MTNNVMTIGETIYVAFNTKEKCSYKEKIYTNKKNRTKKKINFGCYNEKPHH